MSFQLVCLRRRRREKKTIENVCFHEYLDLSDQTDTSSIYFFDHRGCQQGETCLQNFPVRQLSADVAFKCLWGVDRHQHSGRIFFLSNNYTYYDFFF